MRSAFVLLAGSALVLSAPAEAQDASDPRIAELEAKLAEQERGLAELRAEQERTLAELRAQLAAIRGKAPPPAVPVAVAPLASPPDDDCSLADETALQQALSNPGRFQRACFGNGSAAEMLAEDEQGTSRSESAVVAYDQVAAPLPDRSLAPAGIVPQFELGNKSEASLSLAVPVYFRECSFEPSEGDCNDGNGFSGFAPQTITYSASLATELSDGIGNLLTSEGVSDLDITSDTSIQLGVDFVQYRQITATAAKEAINKFVDDELVVACRKDLARDCSRDQALAWVLTVEADSTTTSGQKFKNAELVTKLFNLFWRSKESARPEWGIGGSAKYGTKDYTYQPGLSNIVPSLTEPGRNALAVNLGLPLGMAAEDTHHNTKLELHGFYYWPFTYKPSTPRGSLNGVMALAQLSYLDDWRFPDKSEDVTICPVAVAGNALVRCSDYNIAAPVRYRTWTLAGELRTDLVNLPIGTIGLAPRLEWAFDDGRKVAEFPIYLTSKGTSGGVKLTYAFDGRDTLDNPRKDETALSIFFTPLKFSGF